MNASALHDQAALRRDPVLPPGFACVTLRESGDAFAHALSHAADLGAGSIVWVRRFDLVEFAVVLEPVEALRTARLAHYMAMSALADMMAVHCPPERALHFGWPDALLLDHGLLGGGRTGWPDGCGEDDVPDWLVFGAMIRASADTGYDSGLRRLGAGAGVAMDELGFENVTPVDMVESFARHLMLGVDEWVTKGPKAVVKRWLDRIGTEQGVRRGIEANGDLLVKRQTDEERRDFILALAAIDWLDRERGEPKL